MDKHLIETSAIYTRIEANPKDVVRALGGCQEGTLQLFVLGKNMKKLFPVTQQMLLEKLPQEFHDAAKGGRLFKLEMDLRGIKYCAPEMRDGVPVMMERLDLVVARRSKAGPAAAQLPTPEQATLDLMK